jgi:hypothetical protein
MSRIAEFRFLVLKGMTGLSFVLVFLIGLYFLVMGKTSFYL